MMRVGPGKSEGVRQTSLAVVLGPAKVAVRATE